ASRFAAYVGELTSVIGHADRARPLRDYCAGLVVTEGRRSVEPIAAVTAPDEAPVQHQRLLHFVAEAPWSDEPVLAKVRELVVPAIERHGPIEAWIIDDTSFPKCGSKSVGVQHQYCGQLGKQANCQVVVTLSMANHHASLPKHAWRTITWREGTNDKLRSRFARVRVRTAPIRGAAKRGEETLLIEWPVGEPEPTKYWLATVEKNISFRALVDLAKMRWRV